MPVSTSTVPAAIHAVNGSPRITTPIRIVDSGPIMPVCAAIVAPMRSIAIITISTGANVHATAFSTDSQITCGATCSAEIGLSSRNCTMHSTQATVVARPVRRSAPSRLTSSPLTPAGWQEPSPVTPGSQPPFRWAPTMSDGRAGSPTRHDRPAFRWSAPAPR